VHGLHTGQEVRSLSKLRYSRSFFILLAASQSYSHLYSDFVFLLSGLANVILFTTTRRILPRQSIRFDRWSVTRLRDLPPTPDGHGGDPQAQPEVRMNLPTHISQDGISIKTSPSYHTDGSQTRKDKSRPPDIIIRRDSVESMYSVYDDEEAQDGKHMTIPQRVSSRWSPDGFPQRQYVLSHSIFANELVILGLLFRNNYLDARFRSEHLDSIDKLEACTHVTIDPKANRL
jgi:hypothetical protein